jgi:hypothetical protein
MPRPTFKPQSSAEILKEYGEVAPDRTPSVVRSEKLKRITEMGFDKGLLEQVPEKVRGLTVHDLEDLASKMAGLPVKNPAVDSLSIHDLQGIEALFAAQKTRGLATVAAKLGDRATLEGIGRGAADVDVSCCCCTPCCCCAAAETSPFET